MSDSSRLPAPPLDVDLGAQSHRQVGGLTEVDSAGASANASGESSVSEVRSSPGATGTDSVPLAATTGDAPEVLDLADHHRRLDRVRVTTERVAVVESAVDLAVRPGDDALFIVEHAGRVVRVLDDDTTIVIDLSDRLVGHRPEQGLTGLEFNADGSVAWLHHTDAEGRTLVSAVSVQADGTFDADSEEVVIDVGGPPGTHHNAGDLLFTPDGTLLITLGDGEVVDRTTTPVRHEADPHRTAHDPTTWRGSVLRVRPTPDGMDPYEIPDDNPFAAGPLVSPSGATVEGSPEVLAWGLRNPWKIDVDPQNGALWIADVGREEFEEINVAIPIGGRPAGWGLDFGWSQFEGDARRNDDVSTVFAPPVRPFHSYAHQGIRCAISGGVVYRGELIPELESGYVFADFCAGSVSVLDVTTGESLPLIGTDDGTGGIPGISGIRRGPDGELYVLSWFGEVYRIVPG